MCLLLSNFSRMPRKKINKPNNRPRSKRETNNKTNMIINSRLKIKKIIAIFDAHVPHNLDLKGFIEFLRDEQPNHLILGGDFLDIHSLNSWDKVGGRGLKLEGARFLKEMDAGNDMLDRIQAVLPKKCKIVYLEGNHEDRTSRYEEKNPESEGMYNIPDHLNLDARGIQWIPLKSRNNFYSFKTKDGPLLFTHGVEGRGKYHANKILDGFNCNVRYGDRHTEQTVTRPVKNSISPKIQAKCVPAMCSEQGYMGGRPDAWRRGFYMAYILPDGHFYEYVIQVVNGKFVFNNKIYS
ncbi:hypothetical protein GF366_01645 [Candidatus Peregrinibacteria bacterium]|nr:hypothetical protein [Candidatus Peregrinibacteria bacterium]